MQFLPLRSQLVLHPTPTLASHLALIVPKLTIKFVTLIFVWLNEFNKILNSQDDAFGPEQVGVFGPSFMELRLRQH